jgi:protoheme ferro-lyase
MYVRHGKTGNPNWDRYYNIKNIFAKIFREKIGIFVSNIAVFCQIWITTLVFNKYVKIFAENWWKSPKIGENRRKLVKIAEKLVKIAEKLVKIAENWWKSPKIVIKTSNWADA